MKWSLHTYKLIAMKIKSEKRQFFESWALFSMSANTFKLNRVFFFVCDFCTESFWLSVDEIVVDLFLYVYFICGIFWRKNSIYTKIVSVLQRNDKRWHVHSSLGQSTFNRLNVVGHKKINWYRTHKKKQKPSEITTWKSSVDGRTNVYTWIGWILNNNNCKSHMKC